MWLSSLQVLLSSLLVIATESCLTQKLPEYNSSHLCFLPRTMRWYLEPRAKPAPSMAPQTWLLLPPSDCLSFEPSFTVSLAPLSLPLCTATSLCSQLFPRLSLLLRSLFPHTCMALPLAFFRSLLRGHFLHEARSDLCIFCVYVLPVCTAYVSGA